MMFAMIAMMLEVVGGVLSGERKVTARAVRALIDEIVD